MDINPLHLLKAMEEIGVPQFRGMKFTDFNTWYYMNCLLHKDGAYDIAYGRDECMLSGLACGAKGSIGNGFNFSPGIYQRLRRAFYAGDMATARLEQSRANAVTNILGDGNFGGYLPTARAMYELKSGLALGPPRMPLAPITAEQRAALDAELKRIGFYEWCNDVKVEVQ